MRTGALVILACSLLAAQRPPGPASRVENRTPQAWKLAMGRWVAGTVQVRPGGRRVAPASLKAEGDAYLLAPGAAVEIKVLPDRNGLALQVVFMPVSAPGAGASIFISQGLPADPPTLNINPNPTVRIERDRYGHAADGPFVLIQ
jgi:hypothetical protein